MRDIVLHRGMSQEDAIVAAVRLGCRVERGHHGGEVRFDHRVVGRCVTKGERRDASLVLVRYLTDCLGAELAQFIVERSPLVRGCEA